MRNGPPGAGAVPAKASARSRCSQPSRCTTARPVARSRSCRSESGSTRASTRAGSPRRHHQRGDGEPGAVALVTGGPQRHRPAEPAAEPARRVAVTLRFQEGVVGVDGHGASVRRGTVTSHSVPNEPGDQLDGAAEVLDPADDRLGDAEPALALGLHEAALRDPRPLVADGQLDPVRERLQQHPRGCVRPDVERDVVQAGPDHGDQLGDHGAGQQHRFGRCGDGDRRGPLEPAQGAGQVGQLVRRRAPGSPAAGSAPAARSPARRPSGRARRTRPRARAPAAGSARAPAARRRVRPVRAGHAPHRRPTPASAWSRSTSISRRDCDRNPTTRPPMMSRNSLP